MRASRTNPEQIPNLWQTNPEPMADKSRNHDRQVLIYAYVVCVTNNQVDENQTKSHDGVGSIMIFL